MDMGEATAQLMEIPDGLDDLPPGPELAGILASLDPRRLNCNQLAVVVSCRLRQQYFEEAQLLATVRELMFAPRTAAGLAAPIRDRDQDPWTAMEMSFATTWTEYRSADMVCLAMLAIDQVPVLGEAMREGHLGLDKLRVFEKETELVEPDQRRTIAELALAEVDTMTTAQLRQLLRRLVVKVNPDAVRERRRKAVQDRDLEYREFANGTASLVGGFLDKDKAAAAFDYVDALARATKKAGDPLERELGQLRADIAADLLAGVDPVKAGYATPVDRNIAGRFRLTDRLFEARLLARNSWGQEKKKALRFAFYIRGHWLRMPPLMLARHLWIKVTR